MHQRFTHYDKRCRKFEKQYGMNSDEFIQKFESGLLGDDQDYFDWYAAKKGLDIAKSDMVHL